MRRQQKALEVANFHCTFGAHEMTHLLEEVVLPTFETKEQRRAYSATYSLIEVELLAMRGEDPSGLVVAGRFVKAHELQRNYYMDDQGQRVEDPQRLPSAPASTFVLRLLGHRLLYVREERESPTVSEFQSTLRFHLNKRFSDHVRRVQENLRAKGEFYSLAMIRQALGEPNLEIVHVSSEATIREFIDQFQTLTNMSFRLFATNAEVDPEGMLTSIRAFTHTMKGKQTKVSTSSPDGLDKEETVKHLSAVQQGNAEFSVTGKSEAGTRLSGSNKDMKIKATLPEAADDVASMARSMYGALDSLIQNGVVEPGPDTAESRAALERVRARFRLIDGAAGEATVAE